MLGEDRQAKLPIMYNRVGEEDQRLVQETVFYSSIFDENKIGLGLAFGRGNAMATPLLLPKLLHNYTQFFLTDELVLPPVKNKLVGKNNK